MSFSPTPSTFLARSSAASADAIPFQTAKRSFSIASRLLLENCIKSSPRKSPSFNLLLAPSARKPRTDEAAVNLSRFSSLGSLWNLAKASSNIPISWSNFSLTSPALMTLPYSSFMYLRAFSLIFASFLPPAISPLVAAALCAVIYWPLILRPFSIPENIPAPIPPPAIPSAMRPAVLLTD